MSGVEVEFSLVDNKEDLLNATMEQIQVALEEVGLEAEARVSPLVPVDTGRLRASITHEVEVPVVYVGTNVEYAVDVEINDNMRHKVGQAHYLRDGISQNLGTYKEIIKEALRG